MKKTIVAVATLACLMAFGDQLPCKEVLVQTTPTYMPRIVQANGGTICNRSATAEDCMTCFAPPPDGGTIIFPDGGLAYAYLDGGWCADIGVGLPVVPGACQPFPWPGTVSIACITTQDGGQLHKAATTYCDGTR